MTPAIEIIQKMKSQLAHCMAHYGDQPEELMHKLETLLIEWYSKGLSQGVIDEMKKNSRKARQGFDMSMDYPSVK